MPCDGEGGWYDFNDDREGTFLNATSLIDQWLFNHKIPTKLSTTCDSYVSPLDNFLFLSVGGETSEDIEIDDEQSPYMRDSKIVDGERFATFDSVEEMKMTFTSIELHNSADNSYKAIVPRMDNDILSIDIDLEAIYDRYLDPLQIIDIIWKGAAYSSQKKSIAGENDKKFKLTIEDHVLALIFEFIDTKFLIEKCSFVSSKWHKIILYDSNTVNQIFMSRTLSYFKDESDSLRKLNQWYDLDWLQTYFVCGMFQFELFGERIIEEFNRLASAEDKTFFFMILNFDPLQNLRFLPEQHILMQRLAKIQTKKILVSVNCLPHTIDTYIPHADHCLEFKRDSSLLKLFEKCLFCVKKPILKNELSVDFENTIPLYIEFLKSVANRVSPQISKQLDPQELEWIHKCMLKMIEKANYFMENILPQLPCNELLVEDDILIGLHLILLDNYYIEQENLFKLSDIDMRKLLNNRKQHSDKVRTSHLLPPDLKMDFLELIATPIKNEDFNFSIVKSDLMNSFEKPCNSIAFLKEHVVELSECMPSLEETNDWIQDQVEKYLTFITTCFDPSEMPDKGTDLIFHLHMLHPINFVQDSIRLTDRIKAHNFNFQTEDQ
ncbi:cyclin-like F-box domain-containing protein [Naegleria gruberi]|uniref:Cyclin-like F-box domain-containing protein n=1 Tax=Naegleria gruberi TaxID=5762 RepID=D2VDZ1_NAEGR|nr:cyclin-like F-box domain-containing protein [Naegleria gruberi]EFC45084.1 cyclin-like F-box domain-containing protein [Naegleria gruberi]|eukprot:XP_002677828.1 cyclin-like F-box domain-containing protein [Naegleria gruberi strain NEG-M]